jgi:hypothetical protein
MLFRQNVRAYRICERVIMPKGRGYDTSGRTADVASGIWMVRSRAYTCISRSFLYFCF